jgi:hypothetical protein
MIDASAAWGEGAADFRAGGRVPSRRSNQMRNTPMKQLRSARALAKPAT